MTPAVFLVDDDSAVRDAMRALFLAEGLAFEAYASAEAFLADYDRDRAGCLVLDVRMPGLGGLELQQRLRDHGVRLPVIFLTGHGDVPMSVRALKAGAVDFLEKPVDTHTLLARVHEAIALDEQRRAQEANHAGMRARFERLTPREREILTQVASGKSSKEIARALAISPRTVEVHRARVMEKLGAASLADLTKIAAVFGLISREL